jgi:hypothetical protein
MLRFAKEKAISIAAPPEAVYDYVSDITRHPEWAFHRLFIKSLGEGRYESNAEALHLEMASVLKVETTDRPHRFTFVSQDGMDGTYRWHFDISPAGGGSQLKYGLERLEARLWVQLTQPWLFWTVVGRQGMIGALANIKRKLEGAAQSSEKSSSSSLANQA